VTSRAVLVFALLLRQLLKEAGRSTRSGPICRWPGTTRPCKPNEKKQIWERLKPWLDEGGIHPPRLSDLLLRDRSLRRTRCCVS
jgi:hypothetical protein